MLLQHDVLSNLVHFPRPLRLDMTISRLNVICYRTGGDLDRSQCYTLFWYIPFTNPL